MIRTEREELLGYISDAHKDAYGFRPTGRYSDCTLEELRVVADEMTEAAHAAIVRQEQERADAAHALEARIAQIIADGAGDRATALRWMFDADGITDDVDLYGGSYASYHYDVEYGFFEPFYPTYPGMRNAA